MMCQGIVLNVKGSVVNLRRPLPLKSSQLSGGRVVDLKAGHCGAPRGRLASDIAGSRRHPWRESDASRAGGRGGREHI